MPTPFEWETKTMKGYIMATLLRKISLKKKEWSKDKLLKNMFEASMMIINSLMDQI
jgi:hypothetical protein